MADIVSLKTARKRKTAAAAKQHTLCRNGHHKWVVSQDKQFDVKQGRLVTLYRCAGCNETKVKAH